MAVNVYINGRRSEVEAPTTIASILGERKIRPEVVTVALNREVVRREDYENTTADNGDDVEIMLQMAGGSRVS